MSRATEKDQERRAARLLRWYPPSWRLRYGDEFIELLTSEFSERPASGRRTANVIGSGLLARLTSTGLSSHRLEPAAEVRAGLVSLGCAGAVFIAIGAAMWSQLTIGWQWAAPDTVGTTAAVVVMSGLMAAFVVVALLAAVPVVAAVLGRIFRHQADGLVRPSLLLLAGGSLLVVGAHHFGNGWPGTGGHPWSHQGLVPGGVAAFLWASTLSVSSYWAHPAALVGFPPAEVTWMVVSPWGDGLRRGGSGKDRPPARHVTAVTPPRSPDGNGGRRGHDPLPGRFVRLDRRRGARPPEPVPRRRHRRERPRPHGGGRGGGPAGRRPGPGPEIVGPGPLISGAR